MSINLTQNFVYETDTLSDFKTVLKTMIPILFRKSKPLYAYDKVSDIYRHHLENKVYICHANNYISKQTLDNTIDDSIRIYSTCDDLYTHIVTKLHNTNCASILHTIGDGYDFAFNHCDGDIVPGYRMEWLQCSPEILLISAVHIYYGK